MRLFSLGLNSDISSSRLKLASALYSAGNLERCEMILAAIRAHVAHSIGYSMCKCSNSEQFIFFVEDFGKLCYENNEDVLNHYLDFCVTYVSSEVHCIPKELRYEMFRSTKEDRPYREIFDYWMDWAVVNSLPYMFFLQYKVYSQLQKPADQRRALYNLAWTIKYEINLGHRETALNLLGQCMVHENRHNYALYCYTMSLNIRRRNNAAKWHLCRLLARLLR